VNPVARPFRILGLQQVALGALDLAPLEALWIQAFGCTPVGSYRSDQENVDELILEIGEGPARVEIDLMRPIDPTRSPRVHQPPLNHFGLWVDDLKSAYEWLTQAGVRFAPGGIRRGASGHDVCFIHPKADERSPISGGGVLIELVQAPPDIVQALSRPHAT
jgi:lactoylglutathione lyase